LADSIVGDAHKMLNVPYDCGFYFSKHLENAVSVFQNVGAAYLATSQSDSLVSPLNVGIENSRRFRALPLYASLRSLGRAGYRDILERQVSTARKIADFILRHPAYKLLPSPDGYSSQAARVSGNDGILANIYMIVLFQGSNLDFNKVLVKLINETGQIYVSGTQWDGSAAVRIAVANWKVQPDRETETVCTVLDQVWDTWSPGLNVPAS
jgi:glutamate/tyrosine decarboxylase-like PLP-dependent enzyme